jgi:hypothetical protein
MQDTVQVVRDLGFRFLWIDAICIVQDTEADWLQEASEMSHVHSKCCIDCYCGMSLKSPISALVTEREAFPC